MTTTLEYTIFECTIDPWSYDLENQKDNVEQNFMILKMVNDPFKVWGRYYRFV